MGTLIREFIDGEQGQDLVEYALLCAFIGLAAVATFAAMQGVMAGTYSSWDSSTQGYEGFTPDPLPPPQ